MFSAGAPQPTPGPTGPHARPHLPILDPDHLPRGWPRSLPPDAGQLPAVWLLAGVAALVPFRLVALALLAGAFVALTRPADYLPTRRHPTMSENDFRHHGAGEGNGGPSALVDADRAQTGADDGADFDFDAYLEQKAEATGRRADEGSFKHLGRRWTFTNPSYADDKFADELERLEDDDDATVYDLAAHYMGTEQLDEYLDAGGTAMNATVAVGRAVAAEARKASAAKNGRPTQQNRSSRRRRKK